MAEAEPYFQKVVQHTKALDRTRPVTAVINANADLDQASKAVDIVCINRYVIMKLVTDSNKASNLGRFSISTENKERKSVSVRG